MGNFLEITAEVLPLTGKKVFSWRPSDLAVKFKLKLIKKRLKSSK
jgi:hypothetical protein